MAKICYKKIRMGADRLEIVEAANTIITAYTTQGYRLTLRQLFYRFVSKDLFPASWVDPNNGNTKNTQENYKKLGDICGDARMAGLMDWNALEDRTRNLDAVSHWETPAEIIRSCYNSFRVDKWTDQPYRLEIHVEKDALEGICIQAAHAQDVPVFSCRGYGSLSSLWETSQRLEGYIRDGQKPVILHLGDHDPSGIDMTRDIRERINHFVWADLLKDAAGLAVADAITEGDIRGENILGVCDAYGLDEDDVWDKRLVEVRRIALTRAQVDEYDPPANPAKATDARYKKYQAEHGEECWELDALEPSVLDALITTTIAEYRDVTKYTAREKTEKKHRDNLSKAATHWDNGLAAYVSKLKAK